MKKIFPSFLSRLHEIKFRALFFESQNETEFTYFFEILCLSLLAGTQLFYLALYFFSSPWLNSGHRSVKYFRRYSEQKGK